MPLNKVRVIQPFIGGGFGGTKNDSLAGDFCSVLFSKRTGKPVKFVYTMEEVLMTCRRRHNMIVFNKMGMKKDGTITAMHSRVIADGGAHTAIGPLTMYLTGCMSTLPYKLPNFKHDAYRIYTNNPIGAAMRGHGVTHTRFAAELQMEMMAEELGIDPVAVRLKNAITAPHETVNKVTVKSCGLVEGIETIAESLAWKNRKDKKQNGPVVHGVGMSATSYLGGARQRGHQSCAAVLRLCEDGVDVDLETGFLKCTDMLIAHDCGVPLNPVNVEAQNQGAAMQGMGQALYEAFKMDRGKTLNPTLLDYKMPLATDIPNIEVVDIITEDPDGPYGAKEASEGAIVSVPPSVFTAVHDATGIWFKEQPLTPEKIVMALAEKKKNP